jgi:hypothetical protein
MRSSSERNTAQQASGAVFFHFLASHFSYARLEHLTTLFFSEVTSSLAAQLEDKPNSEGIAQN